MNKELCFFLVMLLLEVRDDAFPVYRVPHVSGQIRVDGALDEFDWLTAPRVNLVKLSHDPEDHKPLRESTEVLALWDEENLYLGFIVQDHEIWAANQARDTRLWPEECVEAFLDPDGDGRHYIEAQLNWNNNIRDLLMDGRVSNPTPEQFDVMAKWDFQRLESAVRVYRTNKGSDLGWTLEIAIPWSEFRFSHQSFPPKPGDAIRVNFYRVERPHNPGLPVEWSGWSPVPGDFHDPGRFGQLVFSVDNSSSRLPQNR